jgi:hypothetical protein
VPFTAQKQNAVIAGVANTLGDGVLASDVALAVLPGSQGEAQARAPHFWVAGCSDCNR